MCIAPAAAAEDKADPEQLYQRAWFIEESLLDPREAVKEYKTIASEFSEHRAIAAKALARAAGCYEKLGDEDRVTETWAQVWEDYRDEVKNWPEIRHALLRALLMTDQLLAGTSPDVVDAFAKLFAKMSANVISPVRDELLNRARTQRETDPLKAARTLRLPVYLSTQIKDYATAASAQSTIGEIWLEQEAYQDAIETYKEVETVYGGLLAPDQHSILAWNRMKVAEAFWLWDRHLQALKDYDKLIEDYPDQKEQVLWGKLWKGDCCRELGDREAAEAIWREVAESKNAEKFPRQQTIARILAGLEDPPEQPKGAGDEFDNDEVYFIAVRHKMAGNADAARRLMRLALGSEKKDWPHMLVQKSYPDLAGLGTGRE